MYEATEEEMQATKPSEKGGDKIPETIEEVEPNDAEAEESKDDSPAIETDNDNITEVEIAEKDERNKQ